MTVVFCGKRKLVTMQFCRGNWSSKAFWAADIQIKLSDSKGLVWSDLDGYVIRYQ